MLSKYFLLELLSEMVREADVNREYEEDVQKGDKERVSTPLKRYKMRLPNSRQSYKNAPYCLLQYISGISRQQPGKRTEASATVRLIFCTQNENEEEGALELLNMMEAVTQRLLQDPFMGYGFILDREAGLEDLVYPDDTRPYYAGEIVATFSIHETERNVNEWLRN